MDIDMIRIQRSVVVKAQGDPRNPKHTLRYGIMFTNCLQKMLEASPSAILLFSR